MTELTRHEFCMLMSAINVEGIDNAAWCIHNIWEAINAQKVFGTDDDSLILGAGAYVAVYFHNGDDYPFFQRVLKDIIENESKCIMLGEECLIFCVEK